MQILRSSDSSPIFRKQIKPSGRSLMRSFSPHMRKQWERGWAASPRNISFDQGFNGEAAPIERTSSTSSISIFLMVILSNMINGLIIITALFYKIPPHLPFPKGGKIPLWQRGVRGDFVVHVNSILRPFIYKKVE